MIKENSLSWSVRKRLEYIEFKLAWDGKINRSDLTKHFGISVPQASGDIGKYLKIAPENLLYSKREKSYFVTPEFNPRFGDQTSEKYLSFLEELYPEEEPLEVSGLGYIPPFDRSPRFIRKTDPAILRKILEAIKFQKSIEINYQSWSRPVPIYRWISPHALANDGNRWHVRGYCHKRNSFSDFVLGRIFCIRDEKESDIDSLNDGQWQNYIDLVVGPNPNVDKNHKLAIEHDYEMENGQVVLKTRISLVYYVLRTFGLSTKDESNPPKEQHLVLLNKNQVKKALEQET